MGLVTVLGCGTMWPIHTGIQNKTSQEKFPHWKKQAVVIMVFLYSNSSTEIVLDGCILRISRVSLWKTPGEAIQDVCISRAGQEKGARAICPVSGNSVGCRVCQDPDRGTLSLHEIPSEAARHTHAVFWRAHTLTRTCKWTRVNHDSR